MALPYKQEIQVKYFGWNVQNFISVSQMMFTYVMLT